MASAISLHPIHHLACALLEVLAVASRQSIQCLGSLQTLLGPYEFGSNRGRGIAWVGCAFHP